MVTIAAMGAVVPEALAAAERLDELGLPADVVCVTSPGLLFRALQARRGPGRRDRPGSSTRRSRPTGPRRWSPCSTGTRTRWPSWPRSTGCRTTALGVTRFGQSGSTEDVYRYHGIDADSIVRAALDLAG